MSQRESCTKVAGLAEMSIAAGRGGELLCNMLRTETSSPARLRPEDIKSPPLAACRDECSVAEDPSKKKRRTHIAQ